MRHGRGDRARCGGASGEANLLPSLSSPPAAAANGRPGSAPPIDASSCMVTERWHLFIICAYKVFGEKAIWLHRRINPCYVASLRSARLCQWMRCYRGHPHEHCATYLLLYSVTMAGGAQGGFPRIGKILENDTFQYVLFANYIEGTKVGCHCIPSPNEKG
ncbi:uncharacterized protein LOC124681601 isoform X2 [Lolium rigidum]|uniref:uncharacterized protein LOC124681601 isoform X2 n=1 Tax=Lolium rigidum TaxID=89674 RepID=UPI001F5E1263|nr:uncharacterized protein LOC124681601 isoform X2 [Lolium rigidum]XP_047072440.1 uncharacterized protein LOC124681601 isoform X2 [Lolium rigidum]XP_047072441.1 uncharacterized protein LOC124681601 isoform X2 [Lolium rigidum]